MTEAEKKAWEAGRDAAADMVAERITYHRKQGNTSVPYHTRIMVSEAIRAIQPPAPTKDADHE